MLGADPRRLAVGRQPRDEVVPPQVALLVPGDVAAGPAVDDHALDRFAAAHGQRLVDGGLQRDFLAAAVLAVGGDDELRAGIDDALVDALGREAAEHDRMDRADARARLHRDDGLDRHRQIDEDAVAGLDAEALQAVRELADAVIELLVGDLGDVAVVALEDHRQPVGRRFEMPVETVVRRVHLAVFEPLVERRIALVERLGERLVPDEAVAGELGPVAGVVGLRLRDHFLIVRLGQMRLRHPFRRGLEETVFLHYGLDRGHAVFSSWGSSSREDRPALAMGRPNQWSLTNRTPLVQRVSLDIAQGGRVPRSPAAAGPSTVGRATMPPAPRAAAEPRPLAMVR